MGVRSLCQTVLLCHCNSRDVHLLHITYSGHCLVEPIHFILQLNNVVSLPSFSVEKDVSGVGKRR